MKQTLPLNKVKLYGRDIIKNFQSTLPNLPNYRKIVNVEFIQSNNEIYVTEMNVAVNLGQRLKFFFDIDTIKSITESYTEVELLLSAWEKDNLFNPEDELIKYFHSLFLGLDKQFKVTYLTEDDIQSFSYNDLTPDVFYIINAWFPHEFDQLCVDKELFLGGVNEEYKIPKINWNTIDDEYVIIKKNGYDRGTGIEIKKVTKRNKHKIKNTKDALIEKYIDIDEVKGRKIEYVPYYFVSHSDCEFAFTNFEYFTQYTSPIVKKGELNGHVAPYSAIVTGSKILTNRGGVDVETIKKGDTLIVLKNKHISTFGLFPNNASTGTDWFKIELTDKQMLDMTEEHVTVDAVFENISYGYYLINNEIRISEAHFVMSNLGNLWRLYKTDRLHKASKLLSDEIKYIEEIRYHPGRIRTYAICTSSDANYDGSFINVNGYWILSV